MGISRIIVLDDLSPDGLAQLSAAEGIEYEVRTGMKGADLRQVLMGFDGAICRSGVKLTAEELRHDKGAFSSVMVAEVQADGRTLQAAGTLFGKRMARLVEVSGHRLEAYMDGCLLIFHHRDVPGIIGAIGTILGDHEVNIAQMAVGRTIPGQEAVGVLNLDSEPPREAMQEVLKHPAIQEVAMIHFPPAEQLPPWLH